MAPPFPSHAHFPFFSHIPNLSHSSVIRRKGTGELPTISCLLQEICWCQHWAAASVQSLQTPARSQWGSSWSGTKMGAKKVKLTDTNANWAVGFYFGFFLINCTRPMSALTGSSRKHHLPMTLCLREVKKTWRIHQTLLHHYKLSHFWEEGAGDSPGKLNNFMPVLGILPQPCSKTVLPVAGVLGKLNKIFFTPRPPNYTSVVLVTSWIKERLLPCWSSPADTQGQPNSPFCLEHLTSVSPWLPFCCRHSFPPLLLSDILSTTSPALSGL